MGVEYRIKLPSDYRPDFERYIRECRFFHSFDSQFSIFNLRISGPEKGVDFPDAYLSFEETGILFSDNLTSRKDAAAILVEIIDHSLQKYDRVTIEET